MIPWRTEEMDRKRWGKIKGVIGDKKVKMIYPAAQLIATKK